MTNPARLIVVSLALVTILAISFFRPDWIAKPADEKRDLLRRELRSIPAPPGAVSLEGSEGSRREKVLLFQPFVSPIKYPELIAFYDRELAKLGWTFVTETKTLEWMRDLGDVERHYCKQDDEAIVHFAGGKAQHEWNFAIALTWGLGNLCKLDHNRR